MKPPFDSPSLNVGDHIRIVAPSGAFSEERFEAGVAILRAEGFKVSWPEGLYRRHRYLAGDDAHRIEDLRDAWLNPEYDALWCARGGYGAGRVLKEFSALAKRSKYLIGFSDISALHHAQRLRNTVSLHGANVTTLSSWSEEARAHLFALSRNERGQQREFSAEQIWGEAVIDESIRVIGGNLCVLASLCGTLKWPLCDGAFVFLEEVGEQPYRIDRMLVQLRDSGYFEGSGGVLLGQFHRCGDFEEIRNIIVEVLQEHTPVIFEGLPWGHADSSCGVPLGADIEAFANEGRLTLRY